MPTLKFITAALIGASILLTTACRPGNANGVFVGGFSDERPMFRTKIALPSEEGKYRLTYELRQGDTVCALTGRLAEDDSPASNDCMGRKGTGKIACNDGRVVSLRWILTSCAGGFGRSIDPAGPSFFFGFEHDKERALDQLAKAQRAG